MAHAVKISSLTEQLVASITQNNLKKNATTFRTSKDAAIKKLRHHNFGRTNQFAVRNSLEGLIEKFEIINKDQLAAALGSRLKRLSELDNALEPEFLSLLLHLSDRPAEKTRLELLKTAAEEPDRPHQLTWEEILADDPLHSDVPWDEFDESTLSSEDEDNSISVNSQAPSDSPNETARRDSTGDEIADLGFLKLQVDESVLKNLQTAQLRQSHASSVKKQGNTELELVREVLNALLGLPSSLFGGEKPNERVPPSIHHSLDGVSDESMASIILDLAHIAGQLSSLRNFIHSYQKEHVFQTLAHAIGQRVGDIDSLLAQKQKAFAAPNGPALVSILNLRASIEPEVKHLILLKDLVGRAKRFSKNEGYKLLDDLYGLTCTTQAISDHPGFELFARIFLACLQSYLRPITVWMELGEVTEGLELVTASSPSEDCDLGSFWVDGYSIAQANGRPRIPEFALEAAEYIFASGKSVAFLKLLGTKSTFENIDIKAHDGVLTLENIQQGDSRNNSLFSFDTLFKQAFYKWVEDKHHTPSRVLRDDLVHRWALLDVVGALEYLYLFKDGAASKDFADRLFKRLEGNKKKTRWNDRFAVEGLARDYLSIQRCVDSRSVIVKQDSTSETNPKRTLHALSSIKLIYEYPFPIQNIIPKTSLNIYQQAFTLLLQVNRCQSFLSSHRPGELNVLRSDSSQAVPQKHFGLVAHSLHHRLLHLVTTTQHYLTQNAIEALSVRLRSCIDEAQDVDALITAHKEYMRGLEKKLLFSTEAQSARLALLKLLDLARIFCEDLGPMDFADRVTKNRICETADRGGLVSGSEDSHAESDDMLEIPEIPMGSVNWEDRLARIRQIHVQHAKLLSILIASLQSASRAPEGDPFWQQLAEALEWSRER